MTIAFTGENGEPVTLQKELLVKKYSSAIKNLKVNGKKVKIKGTRKYEYSVKNKKSSGRVKLSVKKGWKVTRVTSTLIIGAGDTFKNYSKSITKKNILNGRKFRFPKKWDDLYIRITMKNREGETIHYDIHMYR